MVLRRRGLGGHAQVRVDKSPADQWAPGFEENTIPLVELSELTHGGATAPAFVGKAVPSGDSGVLSEFVLKQKERSIHNNLDLTIHTALEKGVTPDSLKGRDGTDGKGGDDKTGETRRRSSFNQTRSKPLSESRVSLDPSVFTLDQTQRSSPPGTLGVRASPGQAGGMGGSAGHGSDPVSAGAAVSAGRGLDLDFPSVNAQTSHLDPDRAPITHTNGATGPRPGGREGGESANGHVLKLQTGPNPEPRGRGLVFQEAGEGRGQEGEETRSRSRRSWIWNQFFVIEEYSGPEPVLIGRLHTDMDRGDGRTKYVLRGEGAGAVFVIDEKTGNIHVTKPLDREEKDEYRLIATAMDRQTERALEPSSQFIIRVQDINDNPPLFEDGPYSATVSEMANIGTSIIQVTATDADDPTYGNSARLVYTLVQGQQYFSVDPQTGILRTAVPDMDREAQDQHLVVLQAKDMGGHLGGLSGTTTVTIRLTDVNDNPPRFTQSMWSFSVSELAVPGAEVGRLSATDADLGDNAKLEYTIVDGEVGDTFNITGLNQEAIITLNKAVDYEGRSSYSFMVEVLNPMVDPRFLRRGPFKDRASVHVTVLDADEPPRFSRARYRLDVSENCPPACTVGRVGAVDPDTGLGSNIRYSIDPQSDPETLFRIAPDNGLITTAVELDREREQWHNITVIATQRDSPSQVSRVVVAIETLDVNDNAPELDRQYTTALCDSAAAGQVVQVLRAIDKDKGGNHSEVHFSIPPGSSAARNFSVRASGGPTASLVLLSPLPPLSRSPSSSLSLQVPLVLKDSMSGLTSTGTVTVSVCPCLRGGARAGEKDGQTEAEWERETVCLPLSSSSPSPGLSTAALLAILACVVTLLAVSALSLSLRGQKRDSLTPLEEDDVRENIITYDDEGGGEADTAAFDITALQSAPHSSHRGYHTLDSRNIRYSSQTQERSRTYSWAQRPDLPYPSSSLCGRLCYSSHTLPVLRHAHTPGLLEPAYRFPGTSRTQAEPQGATGGGSDCRPVGRVRGLSSSWAYDSATLPPAGRHCYRAGLSPTRISTGASVPSLSSSTDQASTPATASAQGNANGDDTESQAVPGFCCGYSSGQQGEQQQQDMTLGRHRLQWDGGIPLAGTTCGLYPEGVGLMADWGGGFGLGRKDMLPQLLPFPGQNRGVLGQFGLGGGWGRGGGNSLAVRVGEFLRLRLAQVTFDPSLPPYDSVQIYGFEGKGSRAGSLSSLESEGEKEVVEEWGTVEEWGPRFQRLAELFWEREREKEEEEKGREKEREKEREKGEADGGENETGEEEDRLGDEGKQKE
ncbi:hypothetical protein AAFF_G00437440 [Aldrovandia affinis]|uniref:Cadherin-22 n=1 Tax=Aldrovandia affinis TaxID=143900 RepID=A0AAD7WHY5_9TELE|nr:hypothetical protein AAFF_G00437440 [Aldrovandia affinis]